MSPQFQTDLMYYTIQFAKQQAAQDQFDDEFGIPRTNLAYAKAIEREATRNRIKVPFEVQKQHFIYELNCKAYAKAINT